MRQGMPCQTLAFLRCDTDIYSSQGILQVMAVLQGMLQVGGSIVLQGVSDLLRTVYRSMMRFGQTD